MHHIAPLYTSSLPDYADSISMDADGQISGMIIEQTTLPPTTDSSRTVPPLAVSDLAYGDRKLRVLLSLPAL